MLFKTLEEALDNHKAFVKETLRLINYHEKYGAKVRDQFGTQLAPEVGQQVLLLRSALVERAKSLGLTRDDQWTLEYEAKKAIEAEQPKEAGW